MLATMYDYKTKTKSKVPAVSKDELIDQLAKVQADYLDKEIHENVTVQDAQLIHRIFQDIEDLVKSL